MDFEFNITEYSQVKELFRKHFGVGLGAFIDNIMCVITARVKIDIVLFDDWLHKKFGDYESKKLTMRQLVLQEFGELASELLDKIS